MYNASELTFAIINPGSEGSLGIVTKVSILTPPKLSSVNLAFLACKDYPSCQVWLVFLSLIFFCLHVIFYPYVQCPKQSKPTIYFYQLYAKIYYRKYYNLQSHSLFFFSRLYWKETVINNNLENKKRILRTMKSNLQIEQ